MNNLEAMLDNFSERNILVLGDVMLDRFSYGEIERINPEQPASPLVKITREEYLLGGAGNVASNVVSLGARCCLYGRLCGDEAGKTIESICNKKGITLKRFYQNTPTVVKHRLMAHGQQIARADFGEEEMKESGKRLITQIEKSLKAEIGNYDFVVLSDYDKRFFNSILAQRTIALSKAAEVLTLVDPKPQNISWFEGCTLVSPNKKEAEEITGIKYSKDKRTLEKMGAMISKIVGAEHIVITCGEDGMFYYSDGRGEVTKTAAKEVYDVTGAGDTFVATLALGISSGLNVHESAKVANCAAGIVVSKAGTATVSRSEIIKYINRSKI